MDRLGVQYIADHAMNYVLFDEVCISVSENDYWNDPNRYPEQIIQVEYYKKDPDTGHDLYKDIITGKIYARESFYPRESCARWYLKKGNDLLELRPNLIFRSGFEHEKIRFDDWNGVMAYSDTFNKEF